jgi:peptidoglycan hydrolase-like protein with peptidoglycan-binding domain
MDLRTLLAASAMLLMPLAAVAASAFTSMHPEEAIPDNTGRVAADRYTDLNKQVQERLHALGFDAGPVNGDFDSKTQAALAQFQLPRTLPASGMLDDRTLAELGVERAAPASAGASGPAGR